MIELKHVVEAIQKNPDLKKRKKRRLIRKLGRKRVQLVVLDHVNEKALEDEIITLGDVEAQIDWDAIADFLERIFPLILQLIGLFPG